ncbi:hypothetical protein V6259_18070 [Marinomonas sp. TI.3.20]|uniref:hypothetical protein n=1 Tax=Marinomonas sp. TI.3.20 TaxID=3121296 RepID=UPI00311DA148
MKNIVFPLAIVAASLTGCSTSKGPSVNPSDMATEEFRIQMQDIADRTVSLIDQSRVLVQVNDPDTDWLDSVDKNDPINQIASLGYVDGVWIGTFENLINEVAKRSGYHFYDWLGDRSILDYNITIPANKSTLIELLSQGYSHVPNGQIDLVIRQKEKAIILRSKCATTDSCDGLRRLSNGIPRLPKTTIHK